MSTASYSPRHDLPPKRMQRDECVAQQARVKRVDQGIFATFFVYSASGINRPSGHRPESRANQRSWPKRPVIFSADSRCFPVGSVNSASQYYRARHAQIIPSGRCCTAAIDPCEGVGGRTAFCAVLHRRMSTLSVSAVVVPLDQSGAHLLTRSDLQGNRAQHLAIRSCRRLGQPRETIKH